MHISEVSFILLIGNERRTMKGQNMEENNLEIENMNEEQVNVDDTYVEEQKSGKKRNGKKKEEFNLKKEIFSWIKIFIIAVVIAFVVNNCIIMNANVPSGSMMNTILKGDRMIGLRTAYWFSDPDRGDIAIFENPDYKENGSLAEDKYYVKRVIGLPGDKVVIKNAKIYINDSEKPLNESYLPEEWLYVNGEDEVLEYKVPKDCYFMLGDNRNNSNDARFWTNTYVKRDKILAKAEFKYWSNKKIDLEMFDKATY